MEQPVYYCKACRSRITDAHSNCPSCGANLTEAGILVEVQPSETIEASNGQSLSTAIYAPPGTAPPSAEELGNIKRAASAAARELGGWQVEGFDIGIAPFVVHVARRGQGAPPPGGRSSHLGFWDTREIRRREADAELMARYVLHGRAIQRLIEGRLRPGECVDKEGRMPTSYFLARIHWKPGGFRDRMPPVPIAELPELTAEIERRLREARQRS